MFLLSKHRPKSAATEFSLAAKLNPNIPDVGVGMAVIELQQWRFEQCLAHADKALKTNPRHADALLIQAICLMQWRKFDQVPAVLEKVLKTNPNHLEALSLMAALHIRTDKDDLAKPFIERVRKVNPAYYGLPNTIGEWLAAARQFERAEKCYRQAMALAPELAGPVTDLGRMYMQTGDEDKVVEILEKAHEIDNFRSDVVNFLNLLNRMKKYDVRETEHFIIKVDGRYDAILLEQVAEYMERIYKEVTSDFAYQPQAKTIIEFFPTHSDFSVRITGRGWIGTVGACTGRVIALAAPNIERSPLGTHNWATVLRHEYTHTVTLAATKNRIPHWFTEACAVFEQPDKRNYKFVQMLVQATRTGRLFAIKELDWGFIRPQRAGDRSLAYAQSEWVLEHIIESRGYQTIPRMLKGFRDGLTQAEVFEKIVGVKEKQFDEGFRQWAKQTVKKWGFNPEPPPDYAQAAKAAKEKPDDAKAQAAYAVALYYRNRLSEAEKAARKALELDPKNTRALAVLAVALSARKQYDEAIETAGKLEALDHTTSSAPKVLAQCHIAKKNWAEAIPALELLQLRQQLDSYSYEQLAMIYNQLGQPEKALPNLIHLHRHTMTDPKYARQIAEIYRTMKQPEQALTYFEQITHINPYQPNAYEAMAAVYRSGRQYDKAVAAMDKVLLLQPDSADTWAKAAMMRYLAGQAGRNRDQLRKAKEAAEKALELDPDSRAKQVLERVAAALDALENPA
jgi:tetratricopeptide (TPR) repeat protein